MAGELIERAELEPFSFKERRTVHRPSVCDSGVCTNPAFIARPEPPLYDAGVVEAGASTHEPRYDTTLITHRHANQPPLYDAGVIEAGAATHEPRHNSGTKTNDVQERQPTHSPPIYDAGVVAAEA